MKPIYPPQYKPETAFNYIIFEDKTGHCVNFCYGGQNFGGPKGLKSYIECLRAVQLLQLNLTEFDKVTLKIAEDLKIEEAA